VLPTTPEEVTGEWLSVALGARDEPRRVAVATWEQIGQGYGLTGVVARFHMDGADPPTLIAKFPMAEPDVPSTYWAVQQRDVAAIRRYYERCAREVRFYREIAPRSPTIAPRCYYAAADEANRRIVLLLEDAAPVMAGLASFHARWWEQPAAFPWLPRWGGANQARQERYARMIAPFLARYGDHLPGPIRALVERLGTRYGALLAALDATPATIIHADLHLDNIAFNPVGVTPSAVVLDWQSVCCGPAAVDLAPFIVGALAVEERRRVADDLVRRYHTRLLDAGVAGYPIEHLREECRLALVRQVAAVVIWLAEADTEHLAGREGALVAAALGDGRLIAALLDCDAASLLAESDDECECSRDIAAGRGGE
jgi:phosphotransferase family enzyme